jgi:hypothetical protein
MLLCVDLDVRQVLDIAFLRSCLAQTHVVVNSSLPWCTSSTKFRCCFDSNWHFFGSFAIATTLHVTFRQNSALQISDSSLMHSLCSFLGYQIYFTIRAVTLRRDAKANTRPCNYLQKSQFSYSAPDSFALLFLSCLTCSLWRSRTFFKHSHWLHVIFVFVLLQDWLEFFLMAHRLMLKALVFVKWDNNPLCQYV